MSPSIPTPASPSLALVGLVIFRYGDAYTHLGSLCLDASGGFPGEVYRVNPDGTESAHWRLRGDLTWERVSP